ncbi:MAG: hypothetical protein REI11_02865 [Patulibacter sp.]|nr:hypothetical protein [Patulibacter sp.]
MFDDLALPAPAKTSNVFRALASKNYLVKVSARGQYKVTPFGGSVINRQVSGLDLAALVAEAAANNAPVFGQTQLAIVPHTLAPPALVHPLRGFLEDYPFDTNVFGMTRFPDAKAGTKDPVGRALSVAREVCGQFGLTFHLASDRSIVDDVWPNVMAHMWASRYGIGFFEDRVDRGLNHNLVTEVGAMLMTGRRCALLKDGSIEKMPTDFVGMIYRSVDMSDEQAIGDSLRSWLVNDLRIATEARVVAASSSGQSGAAA